MPRVVRHLDVEAQVVDPVRPLRVDLELGEVERPGVDVGAVVDRLPAAAAVVRAQERAVLGLDRRVDDRRAGAREGDLGPPEEPLGQAVVLALPLPGGAAVVAGEEAGARPAGPEGPRPAPELPHAGEELLRVRGVDRQVAGAGLLVDVEDLLPGLPAVRGLEDAALRVLPPLAPQGGDPGDVGIGRMEDDAGDVLGAVEPHVGPGLAGVERAVDAVADRGAVAQVPLAGAHPDDVRVPLEDGDGADRVHRLVVEDRQPGEAAVPRLPDAARGGPDVDRLRIGLDPFDRRDPAAHRRRPDRAGPHPGQPIGVEGGSLVLRGEERGGEEPQERQDSDGSATGHACLPSGKAPTGSSGEACA